MNQPQVGNYVTPERPAFMMRDLRFWVQASSKEDQLRHIRKGQRARVAVDAFPDHAITGRIESFSPGTGSAFAVLPA